MTRYDVYATVAIEVEADSPEAAVIAALATPLEYWDDDIDVVEVVARAD